MIDLKDMVNSIPLEEGQKIELTGITFKISASAQVGENDLTQTVSGKLTYNAAKNTFKVNPVLNSKALAEGQSEEVAGIIGGICIVGGRLGMKIKSEMGKDPNQGVLDLKEKNDETEGKGGPAKVGMGD